MDKLARGMTMQTDNVGKHYAFCVRCKWVSSKYRMSETAKSIAISGCPRCPDKTRKDPMTETSFEESCPCGNSVKISGYASEVRNQILSWRSIHTRHANSIARSLATIAKAKENEAYPMFYTNPEPRGDGMAYDLINVDVAEPVFGAQLGRRLLKTHGIALCRGPLGKNGLPICCIHNPSDHHMVTWPQNWRGDRGVMERFCPHGNGHPDPDDLAVKTTKWASLHGCECGCCVKPEGTVTAPSPDQPST